ncbi:expressed unknown protein [Ectocarpus siliculosus]|uniref:Uncharacterized protein n=1 Tax=Ectocarpus siliculosus TaxID=2880 RepID=D7G5V9_ECTSI|nr:expressed unknown protein [Ectocarpus siliculosus]|eukprot:CBJ27397.1 expressed unknown protein [Ectocarpus siliculosus]
MVFNNGSASNVAVTNDEPLWRPMVAYEHDNVWLRSNSPTEQTQTFQLGGRQKRLPQVRSTHKLVPQGRSILPHKHGGVLCWERDGFDATRGVLVGR